VNVLSTVKMKQILTLSQGSLKALLL